MIQPKPLSARLPFRNGWLSFLLSGRGVFVFWISFGLAHAILRLNISRTLSLDDSRASEVVQGFALGYQERQPPLYEWLLWCVQRVFGPQIESHLIVRYALIAAIGLACYGAVRAALRDERWAAAASLSLAMSFPVGWSFHEWGTQTILLCVACFATLPAAIDWLDMPSMRTALWLGGAIGLGFMSKFSYPLMLGGLAIACLSMPELRRRLADRRLVVSVAVAFLICSPYLYWLAQVHGNVVHAIERTMITQENPHWRRALIGLAKLLKSMTLFLLPWLAFVAALAPRAFGLGRASRPPGMAERLTLRTMVAAAALVAIGIAAIGATNIAERYMHGVLIIAPVYVFARIARFDPEGRTLRPFAILSLVVTLVVLGVRIVGTTDNIFTKRADRLSQVPFQGLALALKERGVERSTVVTPDVRDAGNLRSFLPQLRVIALDSFRKSNPPRRPDADGACWLIYNGLHEGEEEQALTLHPVGLQRIEVNPPAAGFGAPRRGLWFLGKLDPNSPICR
jgi:4-amino-4-deoxy-L-arabinose transferase-like glycosyltransferase